MIGSLGNNFIVVEADEKAGKAYTSKWSVNFGEHGGSAISSDKGVSDELAMRISFVRISRDTDINGEFLGKTVRDIDKAALWDYFWVDNNAGGDKPSIMFKRGTNNDDNTGIKGRIKQKMRNMSRS